MTVRVPAQPPTKGPGPASVRASDDLRAALAATAVDAPSIQCVLVVAGSTAKRRELQGLITAVAPRIPVLADDGAHGLTLARRYHPVLLLLDLPSLPPGAAVALCQELQGLAGSERAALRTQVIALEPTEVEVQALSHLGATVMSPGGRGRVVDSGDSGRWPKPWPAEESLLQLLRRHLQPARGRGT